MTDSAQTTARSSLSAWTLSALGWETRLDWPWLGPSSTMGASCGTTRAVEQSVSRCLTQQHDCGKKKNSQSNCMSSKAAGMQNVSDVPVKQQVPPEATLAQVHQEGPTTKNGFLRVAEATPPHSQSSANALQGLARRTGTPPPPASHVATGCPCTSRLQLLCMKQIETSTSMLQKKAGSETSRSTFEQC